MSDFSNCENLVTLDIKNNKLDDLSDEIFVLQKMKLLDISNNDLQMLPPELGIMKNLTKIQVEGNPLRSIRMGIRTGGTNKLKKYLSSKIDPNAPRKDYRKKTNNAQNEDDFMDIKSKMVEEAFHGSYKKKDKWTVLVREFKDTSGNLDLRNKDLTVIGEGILEAGELSTLDLSDNKIDDLPPFLFKLNPGVIRINNNLLRTIKPSFVNFRNLREIVFQKNRISSFLDNLTNSEKMALFDNFIGVYSVDLSQNQLLEPPKNLSLFQNLRIVNLAYNRMDTVNTLFEKQGELETLESLDFSNNKLTKLPSQIYKWQKLHSLNLDNNNIKYSNFNLIFFLGIFLLSWGTSI